MIKNTRQLVVKTIIQKYTDKGTKARWKVGRRVGETVIGLPLILIRLYFLCTRGAIPSAIKRRPYRFHWRRIIRRDKATSLQENVKVPARVKHRGNRERNAASSLPPSSPRRSKYTLGAEIKKEERERHVRQGVRDSKRPAPFPNSKMHLTVRWAKIREVKGRGPFSGFAICFDGPPKKKER